MGIFKKFKTAQPKSRLLDETKHIEPYLINQLLNIDNISGRDFEIFLNNIFKMAGYETYLTPEKGDNGIDIFITKDNMTTAIQAKKFKLDGTNIVKLDTVREFTGALSPHAHMHGAIITTHFFTPEAIRLAEQHNIELINREDLITLISKLTPSLISKAYYEKTTSHMGRCEKCGSIKIKKYNNKSKQVFDNCVRYPDCK